MASNSPRGVDAFESEPNDGRGEILTLEAQRTRHAVTAPLAQLMRELADLVEDVPPDALNEVAWLSSLVGSLTDQVETLTRSCCEWSREGPPPAR